MKKIITLILGAYIGVGVFASEFKEVETLEKNDEKIEVIKKESIEEVAKEKKVVEPEKVTKEEKTRVEKDTEKVRIVDLGEKENRGGKAYAKGDDKPFTGKFALFLGDIIEYTETYEDGILNGKKTWYSHSGNVVLEENYKNNKVEGEQRAYYEDGKIKSIVDYKNGRIIGIESLDKNGKVLYRSDLSSGTGVWKYFWENGQVLEEGHYKNWKKDGVWIKYRENGEIDVKTTYNNGRLVSQVWG